MKKSILLYWQVFTFEIYHQDKPLSHLCTPILTYTMEVSTRYPEVVGTWNASNTDLNDSPPPDFVNEYLLDPIPNLKVSPVQGSETPLIAVIGVGYVGIQLVTTFASKFDVIAFDTSSRRLDAIADDMASFPSVRLTSETKDLANATHFLISVPTTLLPDKRIDISHLRSALGTVGIYARPGATVVIESSVAVGMTRQLLVPLMRSRGLKAGMSPEVSNQKPHSYFQDES